MAQFDQLLKPAVEKLYEDERLRSNLTDSEAKVILDWAANWLTKQASAAQDEASAKKVIESELARVRTSALALNTLAKKPGALTLAEAIAAVEPPGPASQLALPRDQLFALVTQWLSARWKLKHP